MRHHEPEALLRWRGHQRHGAIMRTKTFKSILRRARAAGARDPYAVAGAAYWTTAESRYRHRHRRRRLRSRSLDYDGVGLMALIVGGLALWLLAKSRQPALANPVTDQQLQDMLSAGVTDLTGYDLTPAQQQYVVDYGIVTPGQSTTTYPGTNVPLVMY